MEQEKKGCSSCNKKKSVDMEFSSREKTYAAIAVAIVFFTFYGMVALVKDIISLF
jgi:hypothetical protein